MKPLLAATLLLLGTSLPAQKVQTTYVLQETVAPHTYHLSLQCPNLHGKHYEGKHIATASLHTNANRCMHCVK